MDTTTFCGAKKVTYLPTLVEVNETIEIAKNVVNVVVLLPEAGDFDSRESDVKNVADRMKEIFQPAGELEVKEDFESGEE